MFPVLLRIGPVTIHAYGLMMAVGVAFGLWFLYRQSRNQGLDAARIVDAGFYTILISLVGAKLVLFLGNLSYYTRYPGELLSLARSGGVFQGGLVFGVVFALWYFRKRRIPTWKVADIAAPSLALGHGFGRIGCFLAGCCYGRVCETAAGVRFTSEYAHDLTGIPLHETLHPVQLYEAGLNFMNFLVLFAVLRRKKFDGQIFSLYIVNYSLIRYFTEFYRGDHPERAFLVKGASPYLSLSYPQLFCILGLVVGVLFFCLLKKKKRA
ncbi:MAG: prolipoprotein diacylglyceryl transferase [Candidatus Aminicenantes bacterium]|nr:prolipoprotein diacylglyceryl transferase [Candidatus Aminicenantes bacterium]